MSSLKKRFYICLEKFSAKFKDKIICVSKNDYDIALKHLPTGEAGKITNQNKLVLIYNGIKTNTEFLDKEKARQFIFNKINIPDNNQRVIGTISNLYKNKGLEYLIKSAKILNQKYNDLIFIIIGSGPEKKNLESLIKQSALENFYLLGNINKASQYLKAIGIFTLTSTKEGLPYTLLEALEAQISIVCSNLDSLVEIIENNQNGLIFEATNIKDLVYKIQILLNNPSVVEKLKSNTKKSLKKFNFNDFINNIKTLYLE